ncbi:MAG: hypothetical protein V3R81_13125, partial [Gammaproteobacteria bacterium]
DEREASYPTFSYQLVPRGIGSGDSEGVVWERTVEPGLSDNELNELAALVQDSPIRNYVTAEVNLARFIRDITLDVQSQAVSVIKALEEYQADVR